MAGTVQQSIAPTPEVVGNVFVHQYYMILHQSPKLVHHFYQNISKLGRPQKDGVMRTTTGALEAIGEEIASRGYEDYTAEITTVDSQESHNGGVIVLVTGYLIAKDNFRQKFAQSFFLAPQANGYFVLNDVFRYIDEDKHDSKDIKNSSNNTEVSAPHREESLVVEDHNLVQSQDSNDEETYQPSEHDNDPVEEEMPVTETAEGLYDSEDATETNSKTEEVAKKSYASILKVVKGIQPSLLPAPNSSKLVPKSPEQVAPTALPTPPSEPPVSSMSISENLNSEDTEVEGTSIYLKGLPLDSTPTVLENEFKKFGPIKPNGIQVIRSKQGFSYGFVEFEEGNAMQSALEASPIVINGFKVVLEEKKSTSRGNNRGRFSNGGGNVYRHDGFRGRGNFGGGKIFNRIDYGRTDFGNRGGGRGGYPNRVGGDGFRRGERMGIGGGGPRLSRGNGLPMNGAGRNLTPRVSASA